MEAAHGTMPARFRRTRGWGAPQRQTAPGRLSNHLDAALPEEPRPLTLASCARCAPRPPTRTARAAAACVSAPRAPPRASTRPARCLTRQAGGVSWRCQLWALGVPGGLPEGTWEASSRQPAPDMLQHRSSSISLASSVFASQVSGGYAIVDAARCALQRCGASGFGKQLPAQARPRATGAAGGAAKLVTPEWRPASQQASAQPRRAAASARARCHTPIASTSVSSRQWVRSWAGPGASVPAARATSNVVKESPLS